MHVENLSYAYLNLKILEVVHHFQVIRTHFSKIFWKSKFFIFSWNNILKKLAFPKAWTYAYRLRHSSVFECTSPCWQRTEVLPLHYSFSEFPCYQTSHGSVWHISKSKKLECYVKIKINSLKHLSSHHIETSHLICSANKLAGVYMMATLAFNELNQ